MAARDGSRDRRRRGPVRALVSRILAAAAIATVGLSARPALAQEMTGAGSTFVQPLLSRWSQSYLRTRWNAESQPAAGIDYEPVGSQAGIMRIKDGAVDFGATEVPLAPEEIKQYGLTQCPVVIGGVVAAYNIAGVQPGQLKLTGEVLAEIYLGRIKTWSDPAIRALNPGLALPDAPIAPVRRSDGSGTTFVFTEYLTRASSEWQRIGRGLTVAWPVGLAAKGNDGVAETIRRTANAIGYVDFATARKAGLTGAAIRNQAGAFIAPSPESFQAAAANADWASAKDFGLSLVDTAGDAAYPLVATTFILVPSAQPITRHSRAVLAFFDWCYAKGAADAAALGYVSLPEKTAEAVRQHWSSRLGVQRSAAGLPPAWD